MAGQGGQLLKEGIGQGDGDPRQRVGQVHRKSLGLGGVLRIGGGQPRDGRLAGNDGVTLIAQVQKAAAIGHLGVQGGQVHIPGAVGGVLLLDVLQGVALVSVKVADRHGAGDRLEQVVEAGAVVDGPAAIQLAQVAAGQHLENIAHLPVVEMEGPALGVKLDRHKRSFLVLFGPGAALTPQKAAAQWILGAPHLYRRLYTILPSFFNRKPPPAKILPCQAVKSGL